MSVVRWGIIGAGRISNTFANDIRHVGKAALAAVAARSEASARQFADEHGIPNAYGSYEALYADPGIDAVYIATPHTLHAGQARDAMRAGKAVLCEKPLTVTPAECRSLIAAAADNNAYLMEGMWTWFLPAVRKARQWDDDGRIGRLLHVKADFGYPLEYDPKRREYDAELAGGCLLEMGVYPVAFAELFLPGEPDELQVTSHLAPNGVEDDVTMVLRHGDRAAVLATSFRCRLRNGAYLIGDDGYIVIPDFFRAGACSLYRLDERLEHFDDGRSTHGFDYQIAAVCGDLLAGRRQSETVPLTASLAFQEKMAAVKRLIANP